MGPAAVFDRTAAVMARSEDRQRHEKVCPAVVIPHQQISAKPWNSGMLSAMSFLASLGDGTASGGGLLLLPRLWVDQHGEGTFPTYPSTSGEGKTHKTQRETRERQACKLASFRTTLPDSPPPEHTRRGHERNKTSNSWHGWFDTISRELEEAKHTPTRLPYDSMNGTKRAVLKLTAVRANVAACVFRLFPARHSPTIRLPGGFMHTSHRTRTTVVNVQTTSSRGTQMAANTLLPNYVSW